MLPLAYSTLMRWRQREKNNKPLLQKAGPKKVEPLPWEELYRQVLSLEHGCVRSRGTSQLYHKLRDSFSRRDVQKAAARVRTQKLSSMKRISWNRANLAWSIDATEFSNNGLKIVPVQDLASRYRLEPLLSAQESGEEIAAHLEYLFKKHGAPLFLKKDNGSPFNCQEVERVLSRYGVLPLNNPPYYPRYNGSMEKNIRDLKACLYERQIRKLEPEQLQAVLHHLNHQRRRSLKGQTPCHAFHDPARGMKLTQATRNKILRLLFAQYAQTIAEMPRPTHFRLATAWRQVVEAWLRRQGLISVRLNQKPNVSTNYQKNWSHN
jgi:transposase InsO family protein